MTKLIACNDSGNFNFTLDDLGRKVLFFKGTLVEGDIKDAHCSNHRYFSSACSDCVVEVYGKTFDDTEIEKGFVFIKDGAAVLTSADAQDDIIFVKNQQAVSEIQHGHCSNHISYFNGCGDCLTADYIKDFDKDDFGKLSVSSKHLWKGNFAHSLKIQIEAPSPKFQLIRQQMARALAVFFAKEKKKAAAAAVKKAEEIKKTLTRDQQLVIAYAAWKAIEWELLVSAVETDLLAAAQAGATEALMQVETTDVNVENSVNAIIKEYAKNRAAEMVGMNFIGDKLVEDSGATFVIANTTKDDLEDEITKSFDKNETVEQMRERITSAATFSDIRSQFISKNEIARAQIVGHLTGWQLSGKVTKVNIVLSDSHKVYDECDELVEANPHDIESVPLIPAHPNCICSIIAIE